MICRMEGSGVFRNGAKRNEQQWPGMMGLEGEVLKQLWMRHRVRRCGPTVVVVAGLTVPQSRDSWQSPPTGTFTGRTQLNHV